MGRRLSRAFSHIPNVFGLKCGAAPAPTALDRIDVLLLCNPEYSGSLSMLRWSLQGGMEFFSPLSLNSESNNLHDILAAFSYKWGGDTLYVSQIYVMGIYICNKSRFPLVILSSSDNIHQILCSTSRKLLISKSYG